jgi:hypothetical protein
LGRFCTKIIIKHTFGRVGWDKYDSYFIGITLPRPFTYLSVPISLLLSVYTNNAGISTFLNELFFISKEDFTRNYEIPKRLSGSGDPSCKDERACPFTTKALSDCATNCRSRFPTTAFWATSYRNLSF